jgi:hypothetical protein
MHSNTKKSSTKIRGIALLALLAGAAACAEEAVSKDAAKQWLQQLTPLPREVNLPAKVTLKPREIAVAGNTNASKVIEQAVIELTAMLGPATSPREQTAFTITFQLGGAEADPLKGLKNSAQAYRIAPEGDGRGLRLVALSDRGLYYAGKTLQQLIRARRTAEAVEVPLTTVRDWPEMETRGLWGGDSFDCLPWMADRKLNYQENISRLTVDQATKRGHANVKGYSEQLLTLGPRMGIEHAPVVVHLEQLQGTGLFAAYPELRGQGGKEGVICYSQPAFVGVLADWITELGSLPTVERVDVWFTENLAGKGGCQCDQCRKQNWALAEARTVLAAWREAQKRRPGLGLRVLTSEATYADNAEIFAEVPREVGIWYYHSLLTYTARKKPMIDGPVLKAAQAGRWMGVCPSLVAHVGVTEPFTSAEFIHYRMSEFTGKGVRGMIGYATPRTLMSRFNVEAAAEWLWNPAGRTPREFAQSWALREKLRDPEKFVEWTELLGPVEWAIYGSDWPAAEKRTAQESVAKLLAKAKLPELGTFKWDKFGSPWGEFKRPEELKASAAAAERGVKLAGELGLPEFVEESAVVQGYADSLAALWELKGLVTTQGIAGEKRAVANEQFNKYQRALAQSRAALLAWEKVVSHPASRRGHVQRTMGILQNMSAEMTQTALALGVKAE